MNTTTLSKIGVTIQPRTSENCRKEPEKGWPMLKSSPWSSQLLSRWLIISRHLDFPPGHLKPELGLRVETNVKDKGEQGNSGHGMSSCVSREAECSIRTGKEIRKDQNIISELQVKRRIQHQKWWMCHWEEGQRQQNGRAGDGWPDEWGSLEMSSGSGEGEKAFWNSYS